jgi:hypothetical protein
MKYQTKWYATSENVKRYGKPKGNYCIVADDQSHGNYYDPRRYRIVERSDPTQKAWFEFIG